jgi:hypothetical protein
MRWYGEINLRACGIVRKELMSFFTTTREKRRCWPSLEHVRRQDI